MGVTDHAAFMRLALEQAELAEQRGEVPIGAVVVQGGEVIASAGNAPIGLHDPCAHAEVQALRLAGDACSNYRLNDCTLYVTLEPCLMCAGAMIHARIKQVVFGAFDPKAGAVCSACSAFELTYVNHQVRWQGGVSQDECEGLLQRFFARRRG